MEDISCSTCFGEFDEYKVIPKVLNCGHSLCSECLIHLMELSRRCPKCRCEILKKSDDTYPTNYNLLALSNSFKELQIVQSKIEEDLENLKCRIITSKTALTTLMETHNGYFISLERYLSQIEDIEKLSKKQLYTKSTAQLFAELRQFLVKVENSFLPMNSKLNVNLRREDFPDPKQYLFEIYKRISNGESVFAANHVQDRIQYGKITIWSRILIFHALCLSNIEQNATTILFQDLKNCLSTIEFRTFLKIACNDQDIHEMVMIETVNSTVTPQFIKLCTGELGSSYKGVIFVKGENKDSNVISVMKVHRYMMDGKESTGQLDYVFDSDDTFQDSYKTPVVEGCADGSFQIFASSNKYCKGVVGKIESPSNLKDLISYDHVGNLKIIDCGIAFVL